MRARDSRIGSSQTFQVLACLSLALGTCCAAAAQMNFRPFNYDEAKVPAYTLPNPLILQDGQPVTSPAMWWKERRPQILRLFESQMFGYTPTERLNLSYGPVAVDRNALDGEAIREQVTLYFSSKRSGPAMHLLVYLPNNVVKPVPVFVGLNWSGNQAVALDSGIQLNTVWLPNTGDRFKQHPELATSATRGRDASSWQVKMLLAHGYGLATAYYGDIEPDFDGGIQYGVRPLFFKKGQTTRAPDEWGALGAWAWGMSRIVDFLDTRKNIDHKEIVLIGHSRLGKAALWAGAQDTRFSIVISNESGKGGAALLKRDYGETIEHLNVRFPNWFCGNFKQYSNHADKLPLDSNLLLSLIAPRPLYIGTAVPTFLDPKGSFLAAVSAGAVYKLLGKEGLGTSTMPPVNVAIIHTIGFHDRSGKHDVTAYDWQQYIKFADMQFGRTPAAANAARAACRDTCN